MTAHVTVNEIQLSSLPKDF